MLVEPAPSGSWRAGPGRGPQTSTNRRDHRNARLCGGAFRGAGSSSHLSRVQTKHREADPRRLLGHRRPSRDLLGARGVRVLRQSPALDGDSSRCGRAACQEAAPDRRLISGWRRRRRRGQLARADERRPSSTDAPSFETMRLTLPADVDWTASPSSWIRGSPPLTFATVRPGHFDFQTVPVMVRYDGRLGASG